MRRAAALASSFLAPVLAVMAALPAGAAETCSSSTLVSPVFSVARWCGVPPGAGTLRMARRAGGAEEYREVPLDIYREVIRTPNVVAYVAEAIQPRFVRGAAGPAPVAVPAAAAATPLLRPRPALHVTAVPAPAAPRPAMPREVAARAAAERGAVPVIRPAPQPVRLRPPAATACAARSPGTRLGEAKPGETGRPRDCRG